MNYVGMTGDMAFDMFIMDSNKKMKEVLEDIYDYKYSINPYDNFEDYLFGEFGYSKIDFTDGDYMRLKDTWCEYV